MCYYGVITEIWQLDYHMFKILFFKCDWVDVNKGIKVDDLDFTLVELSMIGHKNDSFILASQAKHVFYVQDQLDSKWSVVLQPPQRDYFCNGDDELKDCCIESHVLETVLPQVDSFDLIDESMSSYIRANCEGTWIDH